MNLYVHQKQKMGETEVKHPTEFFYSRGVESPATNFRGDVISR